MCVLRVLHSLCIVNTFFQLLKLKKISLFNFLFPYRDMPSSYEGKWGKITYSLRAQLTQSIWLVHKAKTEFPFLTKSEFPFASKSEMIIIGLKVWNWFSFILASGFLLFSTHLFSQVFNYSAQSTVLNITFIIHAANDNSNLRLPDSLCLDLAGATTCNQDFILWFWEGNSERHFRKNGSQAR